MDLFNPRRRDEVRSARQDERPSVTEVLPNLFIGEYPREEDAEWLKQTYGINAILSLQDDEDLQVKGVSERSLRLAFEGHRMKFVRRPIPDGSADHVAIHLTAAMADLKSLIDAGDNVFLHCNAGLNRAPTIAIAYLRAYGGMSLNEAVEYVKRRRACGPFMSVLEEYFGSRDFKPGK